MKKRKTNSPATRAPAPATDAVMVPVVSIPMARAYLHTARNTATLLHTKKHQTIADLKALIDECRRTIAYLEASE